MKWRVRRSAPAGTIAAPPSKSHTIRAFLVAALAPGTSRIRGALLAGDGESALGAARALGARATVADGVVTIDGGAYADRPETVCDCGNSGTSMSLFTSAAALARTPCRFDGDESLRSRPMRPLLDALAGLGASYSVESDAGDVPFTVRGPIRGGAVTVSGRSSQYVSSLLLSSPLADGDTTISVEGLNEKPYVRLTLWWLDRLGIVHRASSDLSSFAVQGGQRYGPMDLAIPGDFSSATFAAAAGALTSSAVRIEGLDFSDPQGDRAVFDYLKRLGASVMHESGAVTVSGGKLDGQGIDLNATPDALPALAVLACVARGETRLCNVPQARIKETDRIAVMTRELAKMGARVAEEPDGMRIAHSRLTGAGVCGHHDHRVVMALALAGMIADGETVIDTAEAAQVTYPSFVEDFSRLGADIEVLEE